jgi:hypothetical protein
MSPVRCDIGFYIPKDGIIRGHHRENLKSYVETGSVPLFCSYSVWNITLEQFFAGLNTKFE